MFVTKEDLKNILEYYGVDFTSIRKDKYTNFKKNEKDVFFITLEHEKDMEIIKNINIELNCKAKATTKNIIRIVEKFKTRC